MSNLHQVLTEISAEPWAISHDGFQGYAARLASFARQPDGIMKGMLDEAREAMPVDDELPTQLQSLTRHGDALLMRMIGPYRMRVSWIEELFGLAGSYESVQEQLVAIRDGDYPALVVELDMPGSTVSGTAETADLFRQVVESGTRVVGVVRDQATSGAVWLSSRMSELVVSPTSVTGSIGVIYPRLDLSKMLSDEGVVVRYFATGARKSDGAPEKPVSDSEAAAHQARIESMAQPFYEAIASGRGMSAEAVRTTLGDARLLIGTQAIDAGLADRMGTLDEILGEVAGPASTTFGGIQMATKSTPAITVAEGQPIQLDENNVASVATMTAEQWAENNPKGHKALVAASVKEGAKSEVEASAKRLDELCESFPDDPSRVLSAFQDGQSPVEAKAAAYENEKAEREKAETALAEAQAKRPSQGRASDGGKGETIAPEDVTFEAEWNGSSELQSEFGSKATYFAYRRAEAAGSIR